MTWQPWGLSWKPQAAADLDRLDRPAAGRIIVAATAYATQGLGNVIPLKGRPGEWRLRVGDWRVIFTRDQAEDPAARKLVVLAVRPRGGAYRD